MAGLFSSLLAAAEGVSNQRNAADDFWFQELGPMSSSGVHVTHDRALQIASVLACVKVIAETEASLPLFTYRRLDNGDKERLTEHPLDELLHERPNSEHTAVEFREMMMAWCLMRGTAVAEIIPGARGAVAELIPIHPNHVRFVKGGNRGQWFVEVNEPDSPATTRPREEYFVLRAMAMKPNSIEGLDPITVERHTIGAALAVQDYAGRFFKNDASQGVILQHPGHFKTDEDRDRFRRAWNRQSTGTNAHNTRVLEHGMEAKTVGMTNEQAQFLETQKYHDTDIARIFRVQPHKIGILDRATFSNIEQQSIEFVVDTMLPWLVRWEQAVKRDLMVSRERGIFTEHNVSGLLRGDIESRYRAYAIGRNWGWLSANDVRRMENQNSLGSQGDEYLQPTNMIPADAPETMKNGNNGANHNGFKKQTEAGLWVKPSNTHG